MDPARTARVGRLELEQFRVYRDAAFDVPPAGLRVIGANATGKSSLMEAVELLSTTRPRRGSTDGDLIAHGSGSDLGVQPFARVVGEVARGDVEARIELFIQRGERRAATKKLLRVADRPRRASDVVGILPTVTFAPDDLDFVLGPPSVRRRFLDVLLSQIDRRYLRNLSRYARILAQRNGLLKQVAGGNGAGVDQFAYWDEQLVALGAYIVATRAAVVRRLADAGREHFGRLSERSGAIGVAYLSTLRGGDNWWSDVATASGGAIDAAQRVAVAYEAQLRDGLRADLARGATLIGPHRDDILLTLAGNELSRFGSRGQQRLAVLAIKLAEIDTVTSALEVQPVLLLDDVLSELDADHQQTLLDATRRSAGQTWITATDRRLLNRPELADLGVAEIASPGELRTE